MLFLISDVDVGKRGWMDWREDMDLLGKMTLFERSWRREVLRGCVHEWDRPRIRNLRNHRSFCVKVEKGNGFREEADHL